jgi:hypothetical protein
MKNSPTFAEKIEALGSDAGNDAPNEPDQLTKLGNEQVDLDQKKALTAAMRADRTQEQLYEAFIHQNKRSERRIELFESQLKDLEKEFLSCQQKSIELAEKAGMFAERAGWRRLIDFFCGACGLFGTLVLACAGYLKPGSYSQPWLTQEVMDGLFIFGLALTAFGGALSSWTAWRR